MRPVTSRSARRCISAGGSMPGRAPGITGVSPSPVPQESSLVWRPRPRRPTCPPTDPPARQPTHPPTRQPANPPTRPAVPTLRQVGRPLSAWPPSSPPFEQAGFSRHFRRHVLILSPITSSPALSPAASLRQPRVLAPARTPASLSTVTVRILLPPRAPHFQCLAPLLHPSARAHLQSAPMVILVLSQQDTTRSQPAPYSNPPTRTRCTQTDPCTVHPAGPRPAPDPASPPPAPKHSRLPDRRTPPTEASGGRDLSSS